MVKEVFAPEHEQENMFKVHCSIHCNNELMETATVSQQKDL